MKYQVTKRLQHFTRLTSIAMGLAILVSAPLAAAHVVVKPSEALTSTYQTFTVSVPNEKTMANTELKLVIPAAVSDVTPTAKPDWTISTEKTGEVVTAIIWKDGSLPEGLRDDFTFSAKTPDKATSLEWKAYQTYADGTMVSWDQKSDAADHEEESETSGPLSVTVVSASPASKTGDTSSTSSSATTARTLAIVALAVSLVSLSYTAKLSKRFSSKK